jgi:hypothetical protein
MKKDGTWLEEDVDIWGATFQKEFLTEKFF